MAHENTNFKTLFTLTTIYKGFWEVLCWILLYPGLEWCGQACIPFFLCQHGLQHGSHSFEDSLGAPVIMGCVIPPPFTVPFLDVPNWLTCFLLETHVEASLGLLATMAGEMNLFRGSEIKLQCCLAPLRSSNIMGRLEPNFHDASSSCTWPVLTSNLPPSRNIPGQVMLGHHGVCVHPWNCLHGQRRLHKN